MKKFTEKVGCFFLALQVGLSLTALSQPFSGTDGRWDHRAEICFSVETTDAGLVQQLADILSVDSWDGREVICYANDRQWQEFLKGGHPYSILVPPSLQIIPSMQENIELLRASWDYYPTYTAYENMMYQFETSYPSICRTEELATLPGGRKILMAVISDHVDSSEAEPVFLYTSSMHGDELTGYVLMLRLIDHLLSNYGTDPEITNLLNSMVIMINPLSNPDGAYAGGNNSVSGATRFNANGVDINRNFPDPQDGPHPDGNPWQPETLAFMALADSIRISLGANIHGGAEVCNYPWDTWARLPADDDWWNLVCHEYVDTAHEYGPAGYFTLMGSGVTNGYAWYSINGGRQDYMNYFRQCREFTLEISDAKMPPASQLPSFWEYNYRSLINYMKQGLFGLRGTITDSQSGQPLRARVTIDGHDADSSHVFSSLPHGDYYRYLYQGSYDITFSAPGYLPLTIQNVIIQNHQETILNAGLQASQASMSKPLQEPGLRIYPNPVNELLTVEILDEVPAYCRAALFNTLLQSVAEPKEGRGALTFDVGNLAPGVYLLGVSWEKEGEAYQKYYKVMVE